MKNLWNVLMMIAMAIFMLPLTVYATEENVPIISGDYEYTLNEDNEATITAYNGSVTELEIPEKLDGYTVVGIGDSAFAVASLESVVIPNSVEEMGTSAFASCDALKSISLSDNLTAIQAFTFNNCTSLTTIEIPDSVTSIGYGAFRGCGLTQIELSNNITTLEEWAFYGCESLKNVQLGSGIVYLDKEVFKGCTALEKINLSCRIGTVDEMAFEGCTSLTEVTVPQSISEINVSAFDDPTKLTIYGVSGSYAETWANTNGATFVEYEKHATSVSISPNQIILEKGKWSDLPAVSVVPADCTDKVVWTSKNMGIVFVSSYGMSANGSGTTTITATVGEASASCEVKVTSPGTQIIFSYQNLDTEDLSARIYDAGGNLLNKMVYNDACGKTVTIEGVESGTYTVEIYGGAFTSRKYSVNVGSTVVNQEVELNKTGDITGDNTINARDKKLLFNHIAGTSLLTAYDFDVADITGDGTLNARDKKMIYNHIAGTSSLWE